MRYLKPGRAALLGNWFVSKLKMKPTLTVVGRRSGEPRSVPVNVLDHDGRRYLVSPRGETEWARNLRAAGGGQLRSKGEVESFTASEIADPVEKASIITAYRRRWEKETRQFWQNLPDAADHPVFEIEIEIEIENGSGTGNETGPASRTTDSGSASEAGSESGTDKGSDGGSD